MKKNERCHTRDYALTEMARQSLVKPNKFICTCVHCRTQARTEDHLKHTPECCFNKQEIKR